MLWRCMYLKTREFQVWRLICLSGYYVKIVTAQTKMGGAAIHSLIYRIVPCFSVPRRMILCIYASGNIAIWMVLAVVADHCEVIRGDQYSGQEPTLWLKELAMIQWRVAFPSFRIFQKRENSAIIFTSDLGHHIFIQRNQQLQQNIWIFLWPEFLGNPIPRGCLWWYILMRTKKNEKKT